MRVKEDSEKAGLKLSILKTNVMESGPITSWQIDRETMETVTDFLFLGSKITADSDCSHGVKSWFLPGRKAMTNLNSILKSRDITLQTKVRIVKGFSSSCARRSKQSILKEINPEYSLEGLVLKLKLQYFGHLIRRADSLEKS